MTNLTRQEAKKEWLRCSVSPLYFIHNYAYIESVAEKMWIPFHLWQAQARTLKRVQTEGRQWAILKARQLGLSWLMLGFALWLMLHRRAAAIGLFSRREEEAIDLLDRRLKGMYQRLPEWMQAKRVEVDSKKHWALSNGSWARAFPTSAGDSYTFRMVLVDEADLCPDLDKMLGAVEATVMDAGGWMILLGRANKLLPQSTFKALYRAGKNGESHWQPIFLPWDARPDRDDAWYQRQVQNSLDKDGTLDSLHEQYPANDVEALAARSKDKRIPMKWLKACYAEMTAAGTDDVKGAPPYADLEIYARPVPGHAYTLGVDPAEGNPTSDDSALTVLDRRSLEEVAALAGKYQPSTLAGMADVIGCFYNRANLMVERNNHGHAVLLWLRDYSKLKRLKGHDKKEGWLSSSKGKALLYGQTTDAFKDEKTMVHSFKTFTQLASIEGSSLRAPTGLHDDRADSYALALAGAKQTPRQSRIL